MEIATCEHKEVTAVNQTNDYSEASCAICGQRRTFVIGDEESEVITKIGRINGAIVLPPAKTRYLITPEETRLVREGWDIKNTEKGNRLAKGAPREVPPPKVAVEEKPGPEPEPAPTPEPVEEPVEEPAQEISEQPKSEKIYHCKKCDFSTPDLRKLTSHYSSVHSWHHRNKEATAKIESKSVGEKSVISEEPVAIPKETPVFKRKERYGKRRSLSFWKENREKVITDYNSMTLLKFYRTWHLSSNTWPKLRDLLEIPKKGQPARKKHPAPKPKITPADGTLPPFPPFSDSWFMSVQEEWFKSYVELKRLERNK